MHPVPILALATILWGFPGAFHARVEAHPASDEDSLIVMTFNIRYDTPDDGVHAWPLRRADLIAFLASQAPDVLCVQEALDSQIQDLRHGLPDYAFRGVGRDDGEKAGEYSAIFFDAGRFRPLHDGTLWLSETPTVPSRGWDAALPRIVTWVELEDRSSGATFTVFNTHFDHAGAAARAESARLLRRLVDEKSRHIPAIVAGDFNCQAHEEPYRILTRTDGLRILCDGRAIASEGVRGPVGTFSGFPLTAEIDGPRIDYLFVTDDIALRRYETIRAERSGGFLSDHCPVMATLTLP
jgi:endonuclease/exonuclease/phosphatase family metal-dependent hydrolase